MAAERLKRFVPRAPRYVLRPQDATYMRYGLSHTRGSGGIEQTLLVNLSESGVAFMVDAGAELGLGDLIKVEIPVPGAEQIAWFARVVRIQEVENRSWFGRQRGEAEEGPKKILVGLRFEHLPESHTKTIRRGIEASFLKAMRDQQYKNWHYYMSLFWSRVVPALFYIFITACALGFIYYFSLPSANYDKDHGAPWGERYKFF